MNRRTILNLSAIAFVLLLATGCRVENNKNGADNNVKIATPFGGMSVKTNEAEVQANLGLSIYPGAALVHKEKGDKDSTADVNMSFGSFHLGVRAASYYTPDDPQKVIDFYRKDMARYGSVILCKDDKPVGLPAHTQDGLGCGKENQGSVHTDEEGSAGELKAGSRQHQHIVSIDRDGSGAKLGLVALDLPGHLSLSDDDDKKN